jgi:hypothetical protein
MAQTPEERRYAAKKRRLMLLFRISPEEQDKIEKYQGASKFWVLLGKTMGTDHSHVSGLVRGRLDFRINKALGMLENSFKELTPQILRALADYLDNPPAVNAIGPRYGLIGKAQVKHKMIYGPPKKVKKA